MDIQEVVVPATMLIVQLGSACVLLLCFFLCSLPEFIAKKRNVKIKNSGLILFLVALFSSIIFYLVQPELVPAAYLFALIASFLLPNNKHSEGEALTVH